MGVLISAMVDDIHDACIVRYFVMLARDERLAWQIWGSYDSEEKARESARRLLNLDINKKLSCVRIMRAVINCDCLE